MHLPRRQRMMGFRGSEFLVIFMACELVRPSSAFLGCSTSARTGWVGVRQRRVASCTMVLPKRNRAAAQVCCAATETAEPSAELNQDSTPLVDALAEAAGNIRSPLFYPGHKMGRYVHESMHYRATCVGSLLDYRRSNFPPATALELAQDALDNGAADLRVDIPMLVSRGLPMSPNLRDST